MTKQILTLGLLLPAALFIGCGDKDDDTGTGHTGHTGHDGGMTDGGTSDGGTSDGGTSDGGTSDGGTSDGGTSDGGTSDGGTSDGGTSDGGTSDGGTGDGGGDGGTTPPTPSFSVDVFPLIETYSCATCHSDDTWHPGLLLTDSATTYNTLLTDAPDDDSVWTNYVVPGNSAESLLIDKLANAAPAYGGDQMPQNGPPYMTPDEIATITAWIEGGAADD